MGQGLLTTSTPVPPVATSPSTSTIATPTATSTPPVATPVVFRPLPALHGKDH